MVHALIQTHRLLHPNGWLININDLPAPHMIEVQSPETVIKVGWLLDKDDFEHERSVFNALAQVVTDGDFTLEDERDFGYNVHMNDMNELQEWLADWWESTILPDKIIPRLEKPIRDAGQPARIVLRLQSRMTKLRAA